MNFSSCTRSRYGVHDSRPIKESHAMTVSDSARETTRAHSPSPATPATSNWFAALGLAAGIGAVVASSCCVIPLGFVALGAGAGVMGGLEAMAGLRVPLLLVSALGIAGGWGAWWLRRPVACVASSSCTSPERSSTTLALLLCASAIVLAAASWSYIDPMLLKLWRGR